MPDQPNAPMSDEEATRQLQLKPFYLYWRGELPSLADYNLEATIRQGVLYMQTWLSCSRPASKRSRKVELAEKVVIDETIHVTRKVGGKSAVEFSIPANWWQHFKHDKFPAWALRLWPVQVETLVREQPWEQVVDVVEPVHFEREVSKSEVVEWEEGPYYICPHAKTRSAAEHYKWMQEKER